MQAIKAAPASPKVVVVGAGSLFFGRQAIWQMVHSPHLQNGTLALVETDEERLAQLDALARKVKEANQVQLTVEAATDWRDALPGADFVVLSFARDTVKYRGMDCAIAAKYGVRMCSGDTIGPGGIFRAMREFPRILECAADAERLCPEAWIINYINPSTVHGIGLMRFAPGVKSFALCDSLHMPHIKRRASRRPPRPRCRPNWTATSTCALPGSTISPGCSRRTTAARTSCRR